MVSSKTDYAFPSCFGKESRFSKRSPKPAAGCYKARENTKQDVLERISTCPQNATRSSAAQGTEPARAGQLSPATTRAAPGPSLAGMPRGQCASRAARPRVPQGGYYCLLRAQAPVSGGRGTRPGDQAADAASALGGPCPAGAQMGLGRGRGSLCGRPTTRSAGTGGPGASPDTRGPPPATGPRGEAAGAWPPPTGAAGRRPGRSPARRPLRPRPPARLLGRSRRRLLVLGVLNRPPCGTRPVPGAGPLAPAAGLSGSRLGDEGPAGRPSPALLRHAPAARLRPQRGGQRGARRGRTRVLPRARSVCGLRRRRCLYDGDRDPSRG